MNSPRIKVRQASGEVSDVLITIKHVATSGWLSVADSMPDIDETVVLARVGRYPVTAYMAADRCWYDASDDRCLEHDGEPIAWMPLPEIPKELEARAEARRFERGLQAVTRN